MNEERYFQCEECKAVVQGWNAAHWYDSWHEAGCPGGAITEIDRNDEAEEKEMDEKVTSIRVEFYEDNLGTDWDGLDVEASMDRYAEHLVNYLYADYPDAEIEVVQTNGTSRTLVNHQTDHPEVEYVDLIGSKVWTDADWEVETTTE